MFCFHCKRTIGKTQAKVVINDQWWCGTCAYHNRHQPDGQMKIHEGHSWTPKRENDAAE